MLVVCRILLNLISIGKYRVQLQTDDDIASLDDHLKIEGESCPYKLRGKVRYVHAVRETDIHMYNVYAVLVLFFVFSFVLKLAK